jgi:hypothetical protein
MNDTLTASVGLAGPTPMAATPSGPAPIPAIPDDPEPAAAALALLNATWPDAPGILAARIAGIDAELADQVEAARTDPHQTFADFLEHAGRRVKLKQTLRARLGPPAADPPAVEVGVAIAAGQNCWLPPAPLVSESARIAPSGRY